MKRIMIWSFLPIVMNLLLLSACTTPKVPVSGTQTPGQSLSESIKTRIRQAKLTIVAASQTISDAVKNKKLKPEEAQVYFNQVKQMKTTIDQAQSFLIEGKLDLAQEKVGLAEYVLAFIKKQIGGQ